MHPHHPPHPPPNFCCQVACSVEPERLTIIPANFTSSFATRAFWDPVRQDAALCPPKIPLPRPRSPPVTFMPVMTPDSLSIDMHVDEIEEAVLGRSSREDQRPLKRIRPPRPRNYHCPHCLSKFERPSSLAQHMRRHTGEKPFKCVSCKKVFSIASNARRHIRGCTVRRSMMPNDVEVPSVERWLQAEINFEQGGSDRPWEMCAGQPSHRLHINETPQERALRVVTETSSRARSCSTVSSSSTASFRWDDEEARQSSMCSPVSSAASPASTTSSLFDWRIGAPGRGTTGARYRTTERTETPMPIAIRVDVDVVVKVEDEDEDDTPFASPIIHSAPPFPKPHHPAALRLHLPPPARSQALPWIMHNPTLASLNSSSSPFYPPSRRGSLDSLLCTPKSESGHLTGSGSDLR